jgi:hypothetical protein
MKAPTWKLTVNYMGYGAKDGALNMRHEAWWRAGGNDLWRVLCNGVYKDEVTGLSRATIVSFERLAEKVEGWRLGSETDNAVTITEEIDQ